MQVEPAIMRNPGQMKNKLGRQKLLLYVYSQAVELVKLQEWGEAKSRTGPDGCTEKMEKWMDGWWMGGWVDRWMEGWVGAWVDGWMGG